MSLPNASSRTARFPRLGLAPLALVLCLGAGPAARGDTVTFAQFVEQNGANDFQFTNNGSSATFQTTGNGASVFFFYQNVIGILPSDLQGLQNATLKMNLTATADATQNGGVDYQGLTGTIQILRDSAAGEGQGAKTNLLTLTFTSGSSTGTLSGENGGNSASLSATTPSDTVTFSSDFLNFSNTAQRNFSLSFSSLTPTLAIAGNFLQSFVAAGSGTFASDPAPTVQVTSSPEPSTVALIGAVAGGSLLLRRSRRRRRAAAAEAGSEG